jgi:hypothetical protein
MDKILRRKSRYFAILVAVAMVFALFAAAGAAPQGQAHAAVGDTLTVSVPGAADGDRVYLYFKTGGKWEEPEWAGGDATYPYMAVVSGGAAVFKDFGYIGGDATLFWESVSPASEALYGDGQVLGGWVGEPGDKGANPTVFKLASGANAITFPLAPTATVTVTLSPVPSSAVLTYVYAYPVLKGSPGKPVVGDALSPIGTGANVDTGGVATFKLKPGTQYAFQAAGTREEGAIDITYPATWLGGYQGDFANNNKVKIITTDAAGTVKGLGVIKLAIPSGKIRGTASVGDVVTAYNPVTKLSYSVNADEVTGAYQINAEAGVYLVDSESDNRYQVAEVKKNKTVTANFSDTEYTYWNADISIKVKGTVKKGAKLTASVKTYNYAYKMKAPKFKYVWTDGIKLLSKKPTYKVSKTVANSSDDLFVIAYGTKYSYSNYGLHLVW